MAKNVNRRRLVTLIVAALVLFIVVYLDKRLPIITGYAAKGMCSGVFVADRNPLSVQENDLHFFPVSLAKTKINYSEKYVTSTVFGLSEQKAVYNKGCGCILVPDKKNISLPSGDQTPGRGYSYDTISWPAGDKLSDSIPSGLMAESLKQIVDSAFDYTGQKKSKQTAAVVVIYKGQLITEKYADGFTRKSLLMGWSMTKSITNALVGILVKEKKININNSVDVKEWFNDKRGKITMNNLLHMNSGLNWTENYFNLSDVTKMLYKSDDIYSYAIKARYHCPPDSVWFYSSGTANIVSGLIRNIFPDEAAYLKFPYEALCDQVNIRSLIIETDAAGIFVASSNSYATARDWARFGMLYLNNGVWQGKQVLPEGWVNYTTSPAKGSGDRYGAFFWLNKSKTLRDVPEDAYYCDGFKGQRIFIIPSKQLVIVRLGFSSKEFNFNRFVASVIGTLPVNNN